jgi:hypothetical protein
MEAIKNQQRRQRQFMAELGKLCRKWPSITPADILETAVGPAGPKVRLAHYSPATWAHGDLLLHLHPGATGDEVETDFQKIKRDLAPKRRNRGDQKKVGVQAVNVEPGKESIIMSVEATATGKQVKREFQRAKKASWPRRIRKDSLRLRIETYNLYRQGTTIQNIAHKLRASRQAVYNLLCAVSKDIGREIRKSKPAFDPYTDWADWDKHRPRCASCETGRFCPSWERKIGLPSANPFSRRTTALSRKRPSRTDC